MAPKGRKVKSSAKKFDINHSQLLSSTSSSSQEFDFDGERTKQREVHPKFPVKIANMENQPVYSVHDKRKHMGFMNDASDLLFDYRFESFVQNNWPFSEPEGDLCNPKELALAGLSYIQNDDRLSARCVVCAHVFTDLNKNSDPWKLHANKNPDCIIIKIGKPNKPDGYTIKQLMDIFTESNIGVMERAFKEVKENSVRKILAYNEKEAADKNKDDF